MGSEMRKHEELNMRNAAIEVERGFVSGEEREIVSTICEIA